MRNKLVVCLAFLLACAGSWQLTSAVRAFATPLAPPPSDVESPGALRAVGPDGAPKGNCPLEHTDVKAEINGFLARVNVEQKFANPFDETIEAVYTFPLPHRAAVDRMTMRIGDRTIEGKILERDRARELYDKAREEGKTASLLDQERPNVFTQAVANIPPGQRVEITISYAETLDYEDGTYEFVFPMVVGPRYIPGQPVEKREDGRKNGTAEVPDAARISPPLAAPEMRAGHDVSLEVTLDTGVPILDLQSKLHDVDVVRSSDRTATITLKDKATIPNKDFVLRYDVAGKQLGDAVFTHRKKGDGFFTLVLQPPDTPAVEQIAPRELVFVLDTSGSMSGFPIEKAKETMDLAFDALRPGDAFNLITFAGDTHVLFPQPVEATPANLARARTFLESRSGGGGTEMMKAIRAAFAPSNNPDRLRVVCFMTDGYIGNDMELIAEVRSHPEARVFAFGIGNSVNRYLLDGMAKEGRGEVEFVSLSDDGSAAARRFAQRVNAPLLTDVEVDWKGLAVTDIYPAKIPDVFSAKPIYVVGRYTSPGKATITVRGNSGGRAIVREIPVELPEETPRADVLAKLWARERIEAVTRTDLAGIQRGMPSDEVKAEVTRLGLEYGLVTQFTSFLAVEERVVNEGGKTRRVDVPVEVPDGVDREMVADSTAAGAGTVGFVANGQIMANAPIAKSYRRAQPAPPPAAEPELKSREERDDASKPLTYLTRRQLAERVVHRAEIEIDPRLRARFAAGAEVVVEVTIDETGKVVTARAVSGDKSLHAAAVAAAKKWRFKPVLVGGQPARASGQIVVPVKSLKR